MQGEMRLDVLIQSVLDSMEQKKYSPRTIRNYRIHFNRLLYLAKGMGADYPSKELFSAFVDAASNALI